MEVGTEEGFEVGPGLEVGGARRAVLAQGGEESLLPLEDEEGVAIAERHRPFEGSQVFLDEGEDVALVTLHTQGGGVGGLVALQQGIAQGRGRGVFFPGGDVEGDLGLGALRVVAIPQGQGQPQVEEPGVGRVLRPGAAFVGVAETDGGIGPGPAVGQGELVTPDDVSALPGREQRMIRRGLRGGGQDFDGWRWEVEGQRLVAGPADEGHELELGQAQRVLGGDDLVVAEGEFRAGEEELVGGGVAHGEAAFEERQVAGR